jgi:hypothetical protein
MLFSKSTKAEAYLVIREGLNFLQQRSQQRFFNSLLGQIFDLKEAARQSCHIIPVTNLL